MKFKIMASLAVTAALVGCGSDTIETTAAPVPENVSGSVAISGTAAEDETLSAVVTDANGTDVNGGFDYEWFADGTTIDGASTDSLLLTETHVGAVITVSVSYEDGQGFSESATSAATDVVVATNDGAEVSISGIPSIGETLTASVTDPDGSSTSTISYQWAAGGSDIDGATESTYVITAAETGKTLTVSVSYTDDQGFAESETSEPTDEVGLIPPNVTATLEITGSLTVGSTVTASITDPNGATNATGFQWKLEGDDIAGETSATYVPVSTDLGKELSVTLDAYTDDHGYAEAALDATAETLVYSFIVTGGITMEQAALNAEAGDWIGIASAVAPDDYENMPEINFDDDSLQIQLTRTSDAVISGETCIQISGSNTVVDGLIFESLDLLSGTDCSNNGPSSFYINGDGVTLKNSEFRSEQRSVVSDDPQHFVSVKSFGATIERNLFTGRSTENEGSAISIYNNSDADSQEANIVQYNLFKDFVSPASSSSRQSGSHALQVGRSTGSSSAEDGLNIIRYNRFDSVMTERRIMRVQSSKNTVTGNTVVNSVGMIAFEDGYGNTASFNVILSSGDDNDDGGISFTGLGNTITDNYISNMRTTSGQRAGLLLNHDPLSGSGNTAILANGSIDKLTVIARNTIHNARSAIQFEDADCEDLDALLDVDDNLIANESGNANGESSTAIIDEDYDNAGCSLDAASDFDGNAFFADDLSETGDFDFNGAPADNTSGPRDAASLDVDPTTGLVSSSGGVSGTAGVDTSLLFIITEDQVGPNSTWTATAAAAP